MVKKESERGSPYVEAVILAGGKGTRLAKAFSGPKCLAPVNGRPLLTHTVEYLRRYGATRVVVAAGYLGDEVREHVRRTYGGAVEVVVEDHPLGTGGPVIALAPTLARRFLVVNGDTLLAGDLGELWEYHWVVNAGVTIGVVEGRGPDYGHVTIEVLPGPVRHYGEELAAQGHQHFISAGVYAITRDVLAAFQKGPLSLEQDMVPTLARNHLVHAFPLDSMTDIGTPERWQEASLRWSNFLPNVSR